MSKKFIYQNGQIYVSLDEAARMVDQMAEGAYYGSPIWQALNMVSELFKKLELDILREINVEQARHNHN